MELGQSDKYNRLFQEMKTVAAALQFRAGNQRRALVPLFGHPDPQVRLVAAFAAKDFATDAVLDVCEIIVQKNEYPQAEDARGLFKQLTKRYPGQT